MGEEDGQEEGDGILSGEEAYWDRVVVERDTVEIFKEKEDEGVFEAFELENMDEGAGASVAQQESKIEEE